MIELVYNATKTHLEGYNFLSYSLKINRSISIYFYFYLSIYI